MLEILPTLTTDPKTQTLGTALIYLLFSLEPGGPRRLSVHPYQLCLNSLSTSPRRLGMLNSSPPDVLISKECWSELWFRALGSGYLASSACRFPALLPYDSCKVAEDHNLLHKICTNKRLIESSFAGVPRVGV